MLVCFQVLTLGCFLHHCNRCFMQFTQPEVLGDACELVQPFFVFHKSEITWRLLDHMGCKTLQSHGYTWKINSSQFCSIQEGKVLEIVRQLHHVSQCFVNSQNWSPCTHQKVSIMCHINVFHCFCIVISSVQDKFPYYFLMISMTGTTDVTWSLINTTSEVTIYHFTWLLPPKSLSNLTKSNISLAGVTKHFFGWLLAQYLVNLARESQYWVQLTLCSVSDIPLTNKSTRLTAVKQVHCSSCILGDAEWCPSKREN